MPRAAAAVLIHGPAGDVATLCLDLDVTDDGSTVLVDQDAERLRQILTDCGLSFVEDRSPVGGRHLYIPLQERIDGATARELVEALGRIAPSLDPGPHRSPTDGCIRVPGSRHKHGGHQTLVTPFTEAYEVLRRRNPAPAIAALRRRLAPQIALGRAHTKLRAALPSTAFGTGPAPTSPAGERGRHLPLRTTAATGLYDATRYPSPSEARQAVLAHLVRCGWSLDQVTTAMSPGGECAGLEHLYGTPAKRDRLLGREWAIAQKLLPPGTGLKSTRKSDTSPPEDTGGAGFLRSSASLHQLVNDLEVVLYGVLDRRLSQRGREGLGIRFALRALLAYMRMKETQVIDVGCRTVATALGVHHSTAALLLRRLAASSDGIVTKIESARGHSADAYLLDLPSQYRELADERPWRKGKIHGIRAIFRQIGPVAALAYEAIERGRHSPTTAEISRTAAISRTATETALATMAAHGMIHRDRDLHWHITHTTNLAHLARQLGVDEDVAAQISLHRLQRAQWHAYLNRHTPEENLSPTDLYDPEIEENWQPPPDDGLPWPSAA